MPDGTTFCVDDRRPRPNDSVPLTLPESGDGMTPPGPEP